MFRNDSVTCDQVSHELAAPAGGLDMAEIDQHLASCPQCARQAERFRRLDHLWDATRPVEPSEAHWQRLWSQVEQDALAALPTSKSGGWSASASRRWGSIWAVAAVAQAAAVLLAAWVVFRQPTGTETLPAKPPAQAVAPQVAAALPSPAAAPVQVEYELEHGQTLFLVLDARGETVVVKPRFVSTEELVAFDGESPDPYASAFQMTFVMLNAMEGME